MTRKRKTLADRPGRGPSEFTDTAAAKHLRSLRAIGVALFPPRIGGTWVIPSILLVVLYSGYFFPTSVIVGLALAMTAANGWCRMPLRRPWLRLASFVTISVALYYVAGTV